MTQHEKELQQIKVSAAHFFPKGGIIAGGAITSVFTNQPISDVDIYFKSKQDFILAVGQAYDENLWCVAASDRAVTFTHNSGVVQLMHFDFFEDANAVFDAFDFSVCMGAYDIDKEDWVFQDNFFKHAAQRYLDFHAGTRYPYNSLLRVLKYQDKGYRINRESLLRIGLCLQRVEINSWEDLADAIGGQYGERAKIETDKPYTLDAALELFNGSEFKTFEQKVSEEMPGSAYKLLEKVGVDVSHMEAEDIKWLKGQDGWFL